MKKLYLSLVFALSFFSGWSQSKYSSNNHRGDWTLGSSWQRADLSSHSNGIAPSATNIPESERHYFIDGYITRVGDLTFADAKEAYNFSIRDTLVVTGSITFGNKAMNLKVPSGGILVVFGDFIMNNQIEIENGGYLIVKGNMHFDGGKNKTTYENTGTGGLYVGGDLTGDHVNTTVKAQRKFLSDLPPDLYKFVMQDPGSGDFTPLPVELLYFTGQLAGRGVQLDWAASKEWNFSHYTIERSQNAKDYVGIHTQHSEEESGAVSRYTFTDYQPQYGANYYRLKTTDHDGAQEYKGTVVAYAGMKGDMTVSPNPVKTGLVIIRNPGATEDSWLSIQSITGQEMMRMLMPEKELRLPVSVLPAGIYLVKVWNQLEFKQSRLIVQ